MKRFKKIALGSFAFLFVVLCAVSSRVVADEGTCVIQKDRWNLTLQKGDAGVRIVGGRFGDVRILPGSLFSLTVVDASGNVSGVASDAGWRDVELERDGERLTMLPLEFKMRSEKLLFDVTRYMLEAYGCFEE